MARVLIPETRVTKAFVVAACSYEIGAIVTGRFPTITALHIRYPVIGVVLLGALAVHFFTPDTTTITVTTAPPRED